MTIAQLTIDGGEVDATPVTSEPEPLRAVALDTSPNVSVAFTFRGYCHTCPWEGRDRANNLTALRDFEVHAATSVPHALGFDWRAARAEDPDGQDDDRA